MVALVATIQVLLFSVIAKTTKKKHVDTRIRGHDGLCERT